MILRRRATRPTERQRMRPWLEHLLNKGITPGCCWVDRTEKIFSVEWKHGSRHGWSVENDAQVFQKWAEHTGRHYEGDKADPRTWKINFRCALRSLNDVREMKDRSVRKGLNAIRVFKFRGNETKVSHTKYKRGERRRKKTRKYLDVEPIEIDDIKKEIPVIEGVSLDFHYGNTNIEMLKIDFPSGDTPISNVSKSFQRHVSGGSVTVNTSPAIHLYQTSIPNLPDLLQHLDNMKESSIYSEYSSLLSSDSDSFMSEENDIFAYLGEVHDSGASELREPLSFLVGCHQ